MSEHPGADVMMAPRSPSPFHIIAIGASAGGLQALEELFANMSPDLGAAYVVIQHLSPDFESKMDELLRRQTSIPVVTVTDGMRVEPNHIYLPPPRADMIISGGRLLLTDRPKNEVFRLPIDHFFRSLAQDIGRFAIGIVLSGTGSDGSRGIGEIHEAGGLVIAQTTETARFDGMPRNAQATGVVDLVLAPHEMSDALTDYVGHMRAGGDGHPFVGSARDQDSVEAILHLIKDRHGLDFGDYKPTTVGRRIWRRIALSRITGIDEYLRVLREQPEEIDALYHELLIGVTRFFRDHETFAYLKEQIVEDLVSGAADETGLRVWIPACSSGEEVYSFAMMFDEEATRQKRYGLPIKIFATDVDDVALSIANKGLYSEEALLDVPQDLREKYFRPDATGYFRIAKSIREKVVFARHDILSDPPFTGLDFISCRNLLIYLKPNAQKKALTLFHFALKQSGMLLLGSSETPGPFETELEAVSSRHRVFRKSRDVRLSPEPRLFYTRPLAGTRIDPGQPRISDARLLSVYERLVGEHVPPSLLVDQQHCVVHAFAGAEELVRFRGGRLSTNVLDLLPSDLKMAVAGALRHAEREGEVSRYTGIRVEDGAGPVQYEVVVKPINVSRAESFYLITLLRTEAGPPADGVEAREASDVSRDYIEGIESELRYTQENLQATVEELETSNEELQATNEELVASNEELQSTNEELHSVNEELYSVNIEYQEKIEQLTRLTDDMDNLLQSIDVGVVFLDADLRIRKFTNQVAATFNLIPQDVGRRFDNFANSIRHDGLLNDIESVLETGKTIERDVEDNEGSFYLLRILPYRDSTAEITGVLITLIDVGHLKRAEADIGRLSAIVEQSHDAIIGVDLEGRVVSWNSGARRLYGFGGDEARGRLLHELVQGDRAVFEELVMAASRGEARAEVEDLQRHRNGLERMVGVSMSPLRDERGEIVAASVIARDVTERKRAQEQVQRSIKQRDIFLALLSHELRNPLMALLTASRLFLDHDSDEDQREKAADVVRRQTLHMARLLDDLLDVSRMRQDKIEMRREKIDLRDTIPDVLDEVRALAEERGINFDVEISDDPLLLFGDRTRLKQLQANLLTNAFKFTGRGGRVVLRVFRIQDEACIHVEDEGVGIDPLLLDSMFDPFVQGRSNETSTFGVGLGLGLSLVDTVARAHGGTVTATSLGEGHGATFEVRLPLGGFTDGEGFVEQAPEQSFLDGAGSHRVLFVEDQDDNRMLMELALKSFGYDVVAVGTGEEAIQALAGDAFSVGVIDVGLPDMTGLDVARRARELQGAKIRLLAVTGHGRQKDRDRILEAGFDLHLVKPVDIEQLVASIEGDSPVST